MLDENIDHKLKHIAFIMDGNGRWAKEKGLPRSSGHYAGVRRVKPIAEEVFFKYHISTMSLFVFSTENWNRPKEEIDYLFVLLKRFFSSFLKYFGKRGVRLCVSGDLKDPRVPQDILDSIQNALEKTKNNKDYNFNVLFNYGGQKEIVAAAYNIAKKVKEGTLDLEKIDYNIFYENLYQKDLPPVDLLIRTSGEERISNCMIYELAYAEFVFEPTYWPSYTPKILEKNLEEFLKRNRRYGGIKK